MRSLAFTVYGDPVAQGSKRAIVNRHTGRPVVIESAEAKLRPWRQDVVAAAREVLDGNEPATGPVRVTLMFYLRQPKKPKASLPITRPDADKCARAILDALTTAGVMRDDAQVTTLNVRKRYTTEAPRVQVFVDGDA